MGGSVRRQVASFACAGIVSALLIGPLVVAAQAQDPKRHAVSLTGEPKHPANFTHFKWTNPDAPKGGRVRQYVRGTFDSLNQFPAQGQPASALTLVFDNLFAANPDEASTEYGLIAEWISYPPDFCPLCEQGIPVVKPGSRATA